MGWHSLGVRSFLPDWAHSWDFLMKPERKSRPLDVRWTWEGGRGVWAFPFVEQQRKSLRLCRPPVEARLYAATEWPTSTAPVMAHYTPAAYMLVDEKEYLQAYEDVLEKYKGNRTFIHTGLWILVLLIEYLAIRLALNNSVIPATECLTATACGGEVG